MEAAVPNFVLENGLDQWADQLDHWQSQTTIAREEQGWEIICALGDLGQQCLEIIPTADLFSSEGPAIVTMALKQVLEESEAIRNGSVYPNQSGADGTNDGGQNLPNNPSNLISSSSYFENSPNHLAMQEKFEDLQNVFPNMKTHYLQAKIKELWTNREQESNVTPLKQWVDMEMMKMYGLDTGYREHQDDDNEEVECIICYNEYLKSEMVSCPRRHLQCKDCVKQGSHVAIGDGKTGLLCPEEDCGKLIDIRPLEKVLDQNLFDKWIAKIQVAEAKEAGLDSLVDCPFCPYTEVIPESIEVEPIFRCRRDDCKKESCRRCKQIAHQPLRCDEVEKDDEVAKRTYIENKMSEGLFRVCPHCGKKIVKSEACNRMKCDCGGMFCYLCRQPIQGYDHFKGYNPHPAEGCPLYSTDELLHDIQVDKMGRQAKAEMDNSRPDVELKYDPTKKK